MALDRAAGGHSADPREEDLFNRVHEEYNKYFTDLGTEKKNLSDCRSKHEKAQIAVEKVRQQLQELEHEIDQAASLKRELEDLRSREEELVGSNEEYKALLEEIGTLDSALTDARLKLADTRAAESTDRPTSRTRIVTTVRRTAAALAVANLFITATSTSTRGKLRSRCPRTNLPTSPADSSSPLPRSGNPSEPRGFSRLWATTLFRDDLTLSARTGAHHPAGSRQPQQHLGNSEWA